MTPLQGHTDLIARVEAADLAELRRVAEKTALLREAGIGNYPVASQDGWRVVGFKLDEDTAGLSPGLFMAEAAREAVRALPVLLDVIATQRKALEPFANMLPDTTKPKDALQAQLQEWCRAARKALEASHP